MATRTAKATTRTPAKSGTKKPPAPTQGPGGGKTGSVCEPSAEDSEPITPRAFLELYHERALHQIDACRGLLSCAQFLASGPEPGYAEKWVRTARDWIDSAAAKYATKLSGIFDALHHLTSDDDNERELLAIQDGIEATLRRAHTSRGAMPEGTQHEAAYRLAIDVREQWRQLQHTPADNAEQLQRAGRWFVRWMAEQGGPGRLDTLSDACKVEYEAAVSDLGDGLSFGMPHPQKQPPDGFTRAQLTDFIEDRTGITISETNFRELRDEAGIPSRPAGGTGSKARYCTAEIRRLADHLDTTGIRRHAKIATALRARIA